MRSAWLFAGLALVLGTVGFSVQQNERILADGASVRLQLAPIDPRSLMQGDYVALNYEVQNQLRSRRPHEDGYAVVRPDEKGVARLVRVQAAAEPRAAGEFALHFRVRGAGLGGATARSAVRFATNAYFFAEGQGKIYEAARYGEFRVSAEGEPRLVALLDADLKRIEPSR